MYSEVYFGAYSECTWENLESVPSSAIGSILESIPGSELENILGGVLGIISQAGWECTIQCNQGCTSERTWEHAMQCIWQFGYKFVRCSMMYSIKHT
jgi:hypothetical protein